MEPVCWNQRKKVFFFESRNQWLDWTWMLWTKVLVVENCPWGEKPLVLSWWEKPWVFGPFAFEKGKKGPCLETLKPKKLGVGKSVLACWIGWALEPPCGKKGLVCLRKALWNCLVLNAQTQRPLAQNPGLWPGLENLGETRELKIEMWCVAKCWPWCFWPWIEKMALNCCGLGLGLGVFVWKLAGGLGPCWKMWPCLVLCCCQRKCFLNGECFGPNFGGLEPKCPCCCWKVFGFKCFETPLVPTIWSVATKKGFKVGWGAGKWVVNCQKKRNVNVWTVFGLKTDLQWTCLEVLMGEMTGVTIMSCWQMQHDGVCAMMNWLCEMPQKCGMPKWGLMWFLPYMMCVMERVVGCVMNLCTVGDMDGNVVKRRGVCAECLPY